MLALQVYVTTQLQHIETLATRRNVGQRHAYGAATRGGRAMATSVQQAVADAPAAHAAETDKRSSMRLVSLRTAAPGVSEHGRSRKLDAALWSVQALLALIFLTAGAMKLAMPAGELTRQIGLPAAFLRFIGCCELLGALGLVLPGVTRIRTRLTPLAAAGLVVIMSGATVVTLAQGTVAAAVVPLVVGLFATFVVYGRLRLRPLTARRHSVVVHEPEVAEAPVRRAA